MVSELPAAKIHPQTIARHGEGCEGADRIVIDEREFRLVFSDDVSVGAVLVEEAGKEVEIRLEDPVN